MNIPATLGILDAMVAMRSLLMFMAKVAMVAVLVAKVAMLIMAKVAILQMMVSAMVALLLTLLILMVAMLLVAKVALHLVAVLPMVAMLMAILNPKATWAKVAVLPMVLVKVSQVAKLTKALAFLSLLMAKETLTYLMVTLWSGSLCSRGHTVSTPAKRNPPTPVGTGKLRPILRMRSVFHNNERTRTALPCAAAAFSQPPGSRGCDDLRATRAHRLPTAPLWLSSS